ncbi:MAG: hypothetical protein HDR03_14990 [Lachnospiraceae bacterium]|nr:hypothetical protein [Lachnospiraceae bacterium]
MNEVVTAISTVGFPIVMCLLMFWMNDKQDTRHKEETEKITDALAKLNVAINELQILVQQFINNGGTK